MKTFVFLFLTSALFFISCKPTLSAVRNDNKNNIAHIPNSADPCETRSSPIVRSPKMILDQSKLEANIAKLRNFEQLFDVRILPIVKAASGRNQVLEILARAGMNDFGDSRLQNLCRWKAFNSNIKTTLIRSPALVDAELAVKLSDRIVVTNLETAKALALAHEEEHDRPRQDKGLILFIEQGDLRDGFYPPEDVPKVARDIDQLPGVQLAGIGSHLGSLNGAEATSETLAELSVLVSQVEQSIGRKLEVISSGNSATLASLQRGEITIPSYIKGRLQIRVGFSLFFGKDGSDDSTDLPGFEQDVIRLFATVTEVFQKPAEPWGKIGTNAFGKLTKPGAAPDQIMSRAILNLGKLDFDTEKIKLKNPNLHVIEASSDHLVVDVSRAQPKINTGDDIEIIVDYSTAIHAFQSDHIYLEVIP